MTQMNLLRAINQLVTQLVVKQQTTGCVYNPAKQRHVAGILYGAANRIKKVTK